MKGRDKDRKQKMIALRARKKGSYGSKKNVERSKSARTGLNLIKTESVNIGIFDTNGRCRLQG